MHSVQNCSSADPKCIHCSENHSAEDWECSRWKYEQDILNIADREKVAIQRAKQMLTNNLDSFNPKPKSKFSIHFYCNLSAEHEQKRFPFLLEKCIANHNCSKSWTIGTKDTTSVIEVSSHSESITMTVPYKVHNYPAETCINSGDVQRGLVLVMKSWSKHLHRR